MVSWFKRLFTRSEPSAPTNSAALPTAARDSKNPPAVAPVAGESDPEFTELAAYLRSGKPAELEMIADSVVYDRVRRFYEELCSESNCPKLVYYCMTRCSDDAAFEHLLVLTGTQDEHDRGWHYDSEPALKRAIPGGSWGDVGRGSRSNHSKPGCSLASTGPFDKLASAVLNGDYKLDAVIWPSSPTGNTAAVPDRWDPMIIGVETVMPDLACGICGDKRFVPGMYGTHLKCMRCGTTYCRRRCMASIHGQCPKCGEADRVIPVEAAAARAGG